MLWKVTRMCTKVELFLMWKKTRIQVDEEMAYSRIRKDSERSLIPFLVQ